jgi:hypothetical protein
VRKPIQLALKMNYFSTWHFMHDYIFDCLTISRYLVSKLCESE